MLVDALLENDWRETTRGNTEKENKREMKREGQGKRRKFHGNPKQRAQGLRIHIAKELHQRNPHSHKISSAMQMQTELFSAIAADADTVLAVIR